MAMVTQAMDMVAADTVTAITGTVADMATAATVTAATDHLIPAQPTMCMVGADAPVISMTKVDTAATATEAATHMVADNTAAATVPVAMVTAATDIQAITEAIPSPRITTTLAQVLLTRPATHPVSTATLTATDIPSTPLELLWSPTAT